MPAEQFTLEITKTCDLLTEEMCHAASLIFKNGPFPASFFFIIVFSIQLTVNKCSIDENRRPLVLEATALPTELQPLPDSLIYFTVQLSDQNLIRVGSVT